MSLTFVKAILSQAVSRLPDFILRWMYSGSKLAGCVSISPPPQHSVIVDAQSSKLLIIWPIANFLPFDVALSHIKFDLNVNRVVLFYQVESARRIDLKNGAHTNVTLGSYALTSDQLGLIRFARPRTLWIKGSIDIDAGFRRFTKNFENLETEPMVANEPPN